MLDKDLAFLYNVELRVLNQSVKRNIDRFPEEDFMFQLTKEEIDSLRSQFVILKRGQHSKYLPYAFTEQGIAMLASVLRSKKAIEVNIQIVRAFVRMRKMILENEALQYAIEGLEKRMTKNERYVQIAINAIHDLLKPPPSLPVKKKKQKIGFGPPEKKK